MIQGKNHSELLTFIEASSEPVAIK